MDIEDALHDTLITGLMAHLKDNNYLYHGALCDAVDRFIQDQLSGSHCFLDYSQDGVHAVIGVGPGDAAIVVVPEINIDEDGDVEELRGQLIGLDKFLGELQAARMHLVAMIQDKSAA